MTAPGVARVVLVLSLTAQAGCGRAAGKATTPASEPGSGSAVRPPTRVVVGASPASRGIAGDCAAEAPLCLAWPLEGQAGRDWVVTNYLDLDPTSGVADYTGATGSAAKTYDGHHGVDIAIADFRVMDAGVIVHAGAEGTVESTTDGFFDRNTVWPPDCDSVVNSVLVRHDTGLLVVYLHFRKGSVRVVPGQRVTTGTPLGLVGSSGCSTGPHVHIEVRDAAGHPLDLDTLKMLAQAPAYDPPIGLMATRFIAGAYDDGSNWQDPPPDAAQVPPGGTLGVSLVLSSTHPGDRIGFRYLRPDGSFLTEGDSQLGDAPYRRAFLYRNVVLSADAGDWVVSVLFNGAEAGRLTVPVR